LANEGCFEQKETHIAAMDPRLRRAIELSVREARLERKGRSEVDGKIDQSIKENPTPRSGEGFSNRHARKTASRTAANAKGARYKAEQAGGAYRNGLVVR
jgi:hypothetical protein